MLPSSLREVLEVYEPVIGLEVHAQLLTKTKLFSAAEVGFDVERPNTFITPYCLGLPGVLPRLNERAVELAVTAALALDAEVREESLWARKHYSYPDLPKGYQISQYDRPFAEYGHLDLETDDGRPKRVGIRRIHMEEDAGKSVHAEGQPYSLVDYNRAGVPLVEIVSAPELSSPGEAGRYLRALRAVLVAVGVNDGNLEQGSFRCDANVSIRPRGQAALGTRCEIKNLNSFRFIEQAIEVEIVRHARLLAEGKAVEQETRLYDSAKRETRSLRSKEEAHDYRYFPDPDLPPLTIPAALVSRLRSALPELPAARRARYEALGVPRESAEVFAAEPALAAYCDRAFARAGAELAVAVANLVKGEVLRELKDDPSAIASAKLGPEGLVELARARAAGKISSSQEKKLFLLAWKGADVGELLRAEGEQLSDEATLRALVEDVIAKNPSSVEGYRKGKTSLLSFFVGQVMKATKGKANPVVASELVKRALDG